MCLLERELKIREIKIKNILRLLNRVSKNYTKIEVGKRCTLRTEKGNYMTEKNKIGQELKMSILKCT